MKKMLFLQGTLILLTPLVTNVASASTNTGTMPGTKETIQKIPYVEQPTKRDKAFEGSAKISAATEVLEEILEIPEHTIPPALLKNAHAIAIIPGSIKAAFFLGGRYGSGLLMVHQKEGGWSNPLFFRLLGGGFGWQIGVQSTDIILVFKSSKSISGLTNGKFTFGADASIAAGPLGRSVEAATDVQLKAEIYSYSRNRGLFAGVSLEGAAIHIDNDANAAFYGKPGVRPAELITSGASPNGVQKLKKILTEYASEQK